MHEVLIGQTDYTILVDIQADDGTPATGLTESDIDIAYARVETDNDVTTADVTPAALSALTDAHTDWGFEEVSSGDHPGLYRLDLADAVFASGAWSAAVTITGTGLHPCKVGFMLVPVSPLNGVNMHSGSNGAITAAVIATGAIDADAIADNAIDAAALADDCITAAKIANNAIDASAIADGAIDAATFAAGAINAAAIADGAIDAATFAAGAITAAAIATDAIDNDAIAANAVTEIQSGLATASALATVATYIDTEIATILSMLRGVTIASGTIGATGNDTTHLHLDGLAYADDAINDYTLVVLDVSTGLYYVTSITDWATTGDLATVPTLPFTPQASTDTYTLVANKTSATGIATAVHQRAIPAVSAAVASTLEYMLAVADAVTVEDAVQASPTPTASAFAGSSALSSVDDKYKNRLMLGTSGVNQGEVRKITGYTGSTRLFAFSRPWSASPSAADTFEIGGDGGV